MRPGSKRQVLVCELSAKLPDIAKKLEPWAFKNCIEHTGYRNKIWTHCLSCGNVWPTTSMRIKTDVCDACGWKLKLETTKKQKCQDWARFAVFVVVGEFQVIRIFNINCNMRSKTKPYMVTREIMQHWILPNGDHEIISATCGGMGLSYDHFGSFMSLKSRRDIWKYNVSVYKIHPVAEVLPIFKRNGFNTSLEYIPPFALLRSVLSNSTTETLLKTKQNGLLSKYLGDHSGKIHRFWPSIKICIRNKYIVKDPSSYLDYLEMLYEDGKDLHNAKYVCPADFKKEHHKYVIKRQKKLQAEQVLRAIQLDEDRRQHAEQRKILKASEKLDYLEEKAPYLDLVFTKGKIKITVLQSVEEFQLEGETHEHCVYSSRYYNKKNSLCFSAAVDGVRMETIEINLSSMKIEQARGWDNDPSAYHDQIIELMNKNMSAIRKRYQETKKMAA